MGNYDFILDLESRNTQSVINSWIEPNSEVLEFGPANGRLTKYLSQEKKCSVTIVEIDEESGHEAERFAKKSYIGLEYGDIGQYYWEKTKERYHYIIFADVLEHLSNPREVLFRAMSLLKDKGKILVSIPNVTHNSVLIDMMNDKFEYSDTGLLDSTHIHFFTHKSFQQMIQECGLYICEMIPIYSRVGNNEIENSFNDVPIEVAQYLRKRPEGSIYQYVYKLSASEEKDQRTVSIDKGLEIEMYEQLESLCFCKKKEDDKYSDRKSISKFYRENERVCFEIDLEELNTFPYLVWKPMFYNGVVKVEECRFVVENRSEKLKFKNGNMLRETGNILVFEEDSPWVEFEKIPEEYTEGVIQIVFSILAYKREKEFYKKLKIILSETSNVAKEKMLRQLNEVKSVNEEQKEYITHLENDIKELKDYIEK